jgi:hypothetical protein
MKRMTLMGVAILSAAAGLLAGLLTADTSYAATHTYKVWNWPGGPTAQMNCGWHQVCLPGQYGPDYSFIDWSSATGSHIFWRSTGENTQGISVTGTITVINASSGSGSTTCHRTEVELKTPLGTSLQRIRYSHTSPFSAGSVYNVPSGLSGVSWQTRVGTTVDWDCGVYRNHLHQGRTHTNWEKTTVFPNSDAPDNCNWDACRNYASVWTHWQHKRTWWASGY